VVVRTEQLDNLERLATSEGWGFHRDGTDRLVITSATATVVGSAVARAGIALTELTSEISTRQLEDLFLDVTAPGVHA
jgi:hypothetical protein